MNVNFIVAGGDTSFAVARSSDAGSAQLQSGRGGSFEAGNM